MTKVRVQSNASSWLSKAQAESIKASLGMATDVQKRAIVLAPKDTRNLVSSGRISMVKQGVFRVAFGGGRVPYARIHELGGWTGRGYRTYIQEKHYLGKAGESVARGDKRKYFK